MNRWGVVQTLAILCVVTSGLVGCFCLAHLYWQAAPLAVLFYVLHWQFQGRAFEINEVKSEEVVAMIKFRANRFDPDW